MFTVESVLGDVYNTAEFKEYKDFVLPDMGEFNAEVHKMKIKDLIPAWPKQSMADGLNYLLKMQREKEKIFYPLYEQREILTDAGKAGSGMFFFPAEGKKKFAVICAGGGYQNVASFVESFPIAKKLNEMGYHAFVVQYRTGKYALYPNPQDDLAKALEIILAHQEEFDLEVNDYLLIGFSAGGHLAASFGTEALGYAHYKLPKPGTIALAYPVITMGEYTHEDSRKALLGEAGIQNPNLLQLYSIEQQVTKNYPPVYMWQCEHDDTVSIKNSMEMADALQKNGIKYIYETFPGTAHGWGIGEDTAAEGWLEKAVKFWNEQT